MDHYLLQQLNPLAGALLYSSCEAQIEIRELDGVRWIHFGEGAVQACMSLRQPQQLLLPYTQAMLVGLAFIAPPKRLLNLGVGGGSFIRFFNQTLPDLTVESVDSNAEIIELSRRFFAVPSEHSVYCLGAEDFVSNCSTSYDAIFCDLFGEGSHPECMFDEVFFSHCHRCMAETGVLTANLLITDEAEMISLLQQVRKHFPTLVLLAVPDHTNTILFALKQPAVDRELLMLRLQQLNIDVEVDLTPYVERFLMLEKAVDEA